MKSGHRSTLDSWIAGSAPGIAAGDPSPTREGGVPASFARFASNQWTMVPNQICVPHAGAWGSDRLRRFSTAPGSPERRL